MSKKQIEEIEIDIANLEWHLCYDTHHEDDEADPDGWEEILADMGQGGN